MLPYAPVSDDDASERPTLVARAGRHIADCGECTGRLLMCPCKTLLPFVVVGVLLGAAIVAILIVVMVKVFGQTPTEAVANIHDTFFGASPPPVSTALLRIVPNAYGLLGWILLAPGTATTQLTWPHPLTGTLALVLVPANGTAPVLSLPLGRDFAGHHEWTPCVPCDAMQRAHTSGDYLALVLNDSIVIAYA